MSFKSQFLLKTFYVRYNLYCSECASSSLDILVENCTENEPVYERNGHSRGQYIASLAKNEESEENVAQGMISKSGELDASHQDIERRVMGELEYEIEEAVLALVGSNVPCSGSNMDASTSTILTEDIVLYAGEIGEHDNNNIMKDNFRLRYEPGHSEALGLAADATLETHESSEENMPSCSITSTNTETDISPTKVSAPYHDDEIHEEEESGSDELNEPSINSKSDSEEQRVEDNENSEVQETVDEGKEKFKKTRKRNPAKETWNREANRRKREEGDCYKGLIRGENGKWFANKVRKARKMKISCNCTLSARDTKIKCRIFTEEDRQQIFDRFWKNMKWPQRKVYVASLVDTIPAKDKNNKLNEVSRRSNMFICYLKKKRSPCQSMKDHVPKYS